MCLCVFNFDVLVPHLQALLVGYVTRLSTCSHLDKKFDAQSHIFDEGACLLFFVVVLNYASAALCFSLIQALLWV